MDNSQSFDSWQKCEAVLSTFLDTGLSVTDFLVNLINFNEGISIRYGHLVNDLFNNAELLFIAFAQHPRSSQASLNWAISLSSAVYKLEIKRLSDKSGGLHFNASNASAGQISDFASGSLNARVTALAPKFSSLMRGLLEGDNEGLNGNDSRGSAILDLKTSIHISSLLLANNQRCNLLASINGIFLHSCNASERVIDAVWRMDGSISASSVNRAVNSLSDESKSLLKDKGRSLLMGYTLDNYDIALKRSTGTVDTPISSLVHLTSGLILNLAHTTLSDLRHSSYIWDRSKYNSNRRYPLPSYSPARLFDIRKETVTPGLLNRKESFCQWQFAIDLCTHGPMFFAQYHHQIPTVNSVESVPLFKTETVPLRSMHYQNSTVDGNINAVIDAMKQTGTWDLADLIEPLRDIPDVEDIIILFHGDLGTWERIQAARFRRSLERTSRNRLQFILFIPGLFHIKIACADAIWRIFISPEGLRSDMTSMFKFLQLFYPSMTSKILSNKAGFHVLNDCIVRVGISDRLECWRTYIQAKWPECDTLDKFAERQPTLQDILLISKELALKYASSSTILENYRYSQSTSRDYQYENTITRIEYILQYEELAYSIRCGDVGRIETCLRIWIPIFKGIGKHKYANNLLEFLIDLNFVYPEGLQRAVRSNWVCNPSGKEMGFRGVDWLLELNNLYTKVIYGGSSSNHTVKRIVDESPLIQLYRDCKKVVESQYILTPKTVRHGDPNLASTFAAMSRLARSVSLLQCLPEGRETSHQIPNYFSSGMAKFESEGLKNGTDTHYPADNDEDELTSEDLAVEEIHHL